MIPTDYVPQIALWLRRKHGERGTPATV